MPLLLMDSGFGFRRAFDAAAQMAGLTPVVMFDSRPLREDLTILWDSRRPLPRFAADYCGMLAGYMREIFPISRPTDPRIGAAVRTARGGAKSGYGPSKFSIGSV